MRTRVRQTAYWEWVVAGVVVQNWFEELTRLVPTE